MEEDDGIEEPMAMEDVIMDGIDNMRFVSGEDEQDSDFEDLDEDDEGLDPPEVVQPEPGPSSAINGKPKKKKQKKMSEGSSDGATKKPKTSTYLPGMQMKEGETLVCEESAYVTLHTFTTTSPCLSFDIIPDNLGSGRTKFPATAYAVGGTQAQRAHANNLIVMKLSNVYKTQPKSSDDELSDDESEDEHAEDTEDALTRKPELNTALVPHHGCVNRIRFKFFDEKPLAASWSELGKVSIWDLTIPLKALDNVQHLQDYIKNKDKPKPIFTFKGHRGEGFAMDWSPTMPGVLATGDCVKFIHVWRPHESTWLVDQRPFTHHTASVEDIQWSPNEMNVFASASVDKSIRIWDARAPPTKGSMIAKEDAHDSDVNVIHWNTKDPFIASGGDDCALKIWDLRKFECVAEFKHHHKGPICSVEWNPNESTVLATSGEDDQVAIWDLAVEKDPEEKVVEDVEVPPQLMFIHQGQQDIKEVHWHPQIPGVLISTAASGYNIFKPINT